MQNPPAASQIPPQINQLLDIAIFKLILVLVKIKVNATPQRVNGKVDLAFLLQLLQLHPQRAQPSSQQVPQHHQLRLRIAQPRRQQQVPQNRHRLALLKLEVVLKFLKETIATPHSVNG